MTTKIVPISDLRRQASRVIDQVREGGDVVYVTQHGRPVIVLVEYEQYEEMLAQLDALTQAQEYRAAGPKTIAERGPTGTFASLAAMAQDLGVDDLVEHHDHYLYGVDKD